MTWLCTVVFVPDSSDNSQLCKRESKKEKKEKRITMGSVTFLSFSRKNNSADFLRIEIQESGNTFSALLVF